MKNNLTFSIVLPLYNQESHIEILIKKYVQSLNSLGDTWELLLVINGSKDNSFTLAQKLSKGKINIKVFNLEKGGWGRAVAFGIANATGKYICYTNSARTKVSDLIQILKYAKVNDTVVVKATRIIRESALRKIGSIFYNFENRLLFNAPIWDVNGTPKVFPQKILRKIPIISQNDLIDAELMAKCIKLHVPIIEIPVISTDRISGKSTTNVVSAIKMYIGLFFLKQKV